MFNKSWRRSTIFYSEIVRGLVLTENQAVLWVMMGDLLNISAQFCRKSEKTEEKMIINERKTVPL